MVEAVDAAVGVERERLQARQAGWAIAGALGVASWMAAVAASAAPPELVVAWLATSVLGIAAAALAVPALRRLHPHQFGAASRLQHLGAAINGLLSGGAATLFLPLLSWPSRTALSLAACAGLAGAMLEPARQGSAFRLQLVCCAGQFTLAWWQLDEPGARTVAWAFVGFSVLAALVSSAYARQNVRVLTTSLENRRLAESLAVARDEALAADRAKSHFIAAASHDLRQPAAALALNASLLRHSVHDPSLTPALDGLQRSVSALNELLEQLLDLSRLDAGKLVVEPRSIDVDAMLDELAAEFVPQAKARSLKFRVGHCGAVADLDRVLVMRALRNLLDNALTHTTRGGITLSARLAGGLEISVTDSGCGIAPEHQRQIFDEHFQVGNTSRQRGQGLGLGLAIVRRIASLHDARITLNSAPGRGSRFSLWFPKASMPHSDSRARPPASSPLGGVAASFPPRAKAAGRPAADGLRLLLVEDDELLADALSVWLAGTGFHVTRAVDGCMALAGLEADEKIAVVVSDFRLPGRTNGLEVLAHARDRQPAALRVLLTAEVDPHLQERCNAVGATLMHKPVDPERLRAWLLQRVG
jgi:signal transduction histidine kinase